MKVSTRERAAQGQCTIGLDLGERYTYYCILDAAGEVIERGSFWTARVALEKEFKGTPRMRVVVEAGTQSAWVSRFLVELGHEVLVANPRKLRFIYQSNKKNDKADAEALARVGRLDPTLLSPILHRGVEAQADLAFLRTRDALVKTRTLLVNQARGLVRGWGGNLPKCSTEAFPKMAKYVPAELWPALSPVFDLLRQLTKDIRELERTIEKLAEERYPETKKLRAVNGVGALTALSFVLTLDDPKRFASSRQVGAFLGLQPKQDDSGSRERQLGITKAGDVFLRRLLVQCGQYILGPFGKDSDLRLWGQELMKRGGKNAKKRAVVAVARKLAVLLHRLWVTDARYDPLRNTRRRQQTNPAAIPA